MRTIENANVVPAFCLYSNRKELQQLDEASTINGIGIARFSFGV
ncbi:hypothetical protein [Brevibacillus reuszeri]|nr:hypothetical protein [Brevibacillus reuszeri]